MSKQNELMLKVSDVLTAKMDSLVGMGCEKVVAERIRTIFMLQCRKTPKLLNCTMGSLIQAFTDAGTIGLEPDGINAHLIPYKDDCTYMVDYKGYIRLAKESGEVADMTANVVRANDEFSHEYGSNKHLKHVKAFGTDEDRGKRIAAYSYVRFKDGSEDFRVLTEDEITHAQKSSKTDKIWKSDPDPMWAKTAVRQHAKFLPSQKKLQMAADIDERRELKDVDISDVTESATENNKDALKKKIAEKQKQSGGKKEEKKEEKKTEKKEPPSDVVETRQEEFERNMEEYQKKINSDEKYFAELGELGFSSASEITDEGQQKDIKEYFAGLTK